MVDKRNESAMLDMVSRGMFQGTTMLSSWWLKPSTTQAQVGMLVL
jgi:hypothetical protein